MTVEDALTLRVGDHVLHKAALSYTKAGFPAKRPVRITEVYVNVKRTIVSIRLASVNPGAWLHATEFELPPDGFRWDYNGKEWLTIEEYKRRREAAKV